MNMKIKQLELCNIRGFKKLKFDFSERLNLFVGINGSGKSTVLDSMAIALSWLVNRIEREGANAKRITEMSLRNEEPSGYIEIHVNDHNVDYRWYVTKAAKGRAAKLKASYGGASELAKIYQEKYNEKSSLPVIAYYPIDRAVKNAESDRYQNDSIHTLDVYKNALEGKENFQSFFKWFRNQDDILNEEAQSRTYWMEQNKTSIKRRIGKLLKLLEDSIRNENEDYDREELQHQLRRFKKDEMVYQEPRYLLLELSELTRDLGMRFFKNRGGESVLDDLGYMFQKMSSLGSDLRDNLIDSGGMHKKIVRKISNGFMEADNLGVSENMVDFLWGCFRFSTLLSLWWLSDNSRRDVEKLFSACHPTRRKQKEGFFDLIESLPGTLNHIIEKDIRLKSYVHRSEGRELKTVRKAVEAFIPEYKNLRITRLPRPHMVIDKNGESFDLNQLSDGEKNLIALVGDIARRLTLANQRCKRPLDGEGVIMIDEVDLHLHPSWQRIIIPRLLEVFPNCQFFISTHSPQVISNMKPEDIFLLSYINKEIEFTKPEESYGMSIDRIVELVMDDHSRPDKPRKKLKHLFELIERKKIDQAKKIVCSMKEYMSSDPDLLRAEMLIRMEEKRG